MPHMDDIRCKHCHALIALIPRAAVVGRFTLKCQHCGVLLVVWPVQKEHNEQVDYMPTLRAEI